MCCVVWLDLKSQRFRGVLPVPSPSSQHPKLSWLHASVSVDLTVSRLWNLPCGSLQLRGSFHSSPERAEEECLAVLLTGSPFTVKISGEGRVKESITRTRRAPSVATVGSICDLNLKIPGEHCPYAHNRDFHLCGAGVPEAVGAGTSALLGHPHVKS